MSVPCKYCNSVEHTQFYCRLKPRKPIKKRGKKTITYEKWRDEVAKPYLDRTYGHVCAKCTTTTNLDVDHIQNRGSHPELKMNLANVQYLCREHHRNKTDRIEENK